MLDSGINVSYKHLIYVKLSVKISLVLSRILFLQQTAHCYTNGSDTKQTGTGNRKHDACCAFGR
jgi:hypothetical protein